MIEGKCFVCNKNVLINEDNACSGRFNSENEIFIEIYEEEKNGYLNAKDKKFMFCCSLHIPHLETLFDLILKNNGEINNNLIESAKNNPNSWYYIEHDILPA